MYVLVAGLVLFLGIHSLSIVAEQWRDRMVTRLGPWPWKGLYAVIAVAGLVLIIAGYGMARQDPVVLYVPAPWLHSVAAVLMLFAFPLFLSAYLPGRLQTVAKHPLLVATKLWALAHLLVNGALADVVLFGAFLLWAVADRISMNRRTRRPVPGAPATRLNDAVAIFGGLILYAAFMLWLHEALIGVAPLPTGH